MNDKPTVMVIDETSDLDFAELEERMGKGTVKVVLRGPAQREEREEDEPSETVKRGIEAHEKLAAHFAADVSGLEKGMAKALEAVRAAGARMAADPKLHELARLGIRNPNGSKLWKVWEGGDPIDRKAIRARRKAERNRKRDQRRKRR